MIIDSSALVAVVFAEPEGERISRAITHADLRFLSAANYLESSIVIVSRLRESGLQELDNLIALFNMNVFPVSRKQADIARDAFLKFGKGRHKAGLNFGDCFAYALAKERNLPLLFKGTDFSQTDIEVASY